MKSFARWPMQLINWKKLSEISRSSWLRKGHLRSNFDCAEKQKAKDDRLHESEIKKFKSEEREMQRKQVGEERK